MRFSNILFILLPLCIACTAQHMETPESILRRSLAKNQTMESVHIAGKFETCVPELLGAFACPTVEFSGGLQHGGSNAMLSLKITERSQPDEGSPLSASGRIVVIDGAEVYLYLNSLATTADAPNADAVQQLATLLQGTWWLLPAPSVLQDAFGVSQSALIQLPASGMRIVQDGGEEILHDRKVRRLGVAIDSLEKQPAAGSLVQSEAVADGTGSGTLRAEGDLWIDARSYFLRKAKWKVSSQDDTMMSMSVDCTAHNRPMQIAPPSPAFPLPANALDLLKRLNASTEQPSSVQAPAASYE